MMTTPCDVTTGFVNGYAVLDYCQQVNAANFSLLTQTASQFIESTCFDSDCSQCEVTTKYNIRICIVSSYMVTSINQDQISPAIGSSVFSSWNNIDCAGAATEFDIYYVGGCANQGCK